jgi:hypothetical protein
MGRQLMDYGTLVCIYDYSRCIRFNTVYSLLGELTDIGKKVRVFCATPDCLTYVSENSPHILSGRHCEVSM